MSNKEKYSRFCKNTYVPVFPQPWWMDAVCGEDNWDVWLYEPDSGNPSAAMPYYMEKRGSHRYITKAPLTQNNGVIFRYPARQKNVARFKFEETVINEACGFIESLGLDVYEQQFHYSFENWMPFFWRDYTAITRYTCVIEDTSDMQMVWDGFSANYRKNIRKAQKASYISDDIAPDKFFSEHEKIFLRQGLSCPFPYEFWIGLYAAVSSHGCGKILCSRTPEADITSVMLVVWDEQAAYPLLGGYIPEFKQLQSYGALTLESIKIASKLGLKYDFEGSMIRRVFHSFREFGPIIKPYFRIRKVFNPEIVRREAEDYIGRIHCAIGS